jgi:hypothetical protein
MRVKNFVDLADITAVRFECGECQGAITVPLGRGASEDVFQIGLSPCRFCKAPSGFEIGKEELKALRGLVESLERIAGTTKDRNLKLCLEVRNTDL